MRLTTKARCAVTAMVDMALRSDQEPIALAAISQRQQISLSYLEQLFASLRRHDLVRSTRGPGGGYSLGRPAEEITVSDIVSAVDDPFESEGPVAKDEGPSASSARCVTDELWHGLAEQMMVFLGSISLRKLANDQLERGVTVPAAPTRRITPAAPTIRTSDVKAPNSVFALGSAMMS